MLRMGSISSLSIWANTWTIMYRLDDHLPRALVGTAAASPSSTRPACDSRGIWRFKFPGSDSRLVLSP